MVTTDDELDTEDTEIPKAMEEVKSDHHPQTRKRLYITKELQTNLTVVSHIQVVERMILNRLNPLIETMIIDQQAGFRPGKSTTGQLLNLTQHIEDGYERGVVTGTVFVDLSAAYDTISHKLLLNQIYRMTSDIKFTDIIGNMLSNRRYFVELNGQNSRWRNQKNGLPQGSVLSPVLFNIYTNDQPIHKDTRSFIYADDLCIATHDASFEKTGSTLSAALDSIGDYYEKNHLRANPDKTQTCVFHLRNRKANRQLNIISWCGKKLELELKLKLNDACRAITGCLQPTNVENLYLLAGIAPPAVRRSVTAQREREKQVNDNRHPLHGHNLPRKRLKSRNSFIRATDELIQSPSTRRLEQWSQHLQSVPHRLPQTPSECLASGASGTWTEWRCLNRLRTKMGRCKHNLRKWKYTDEDDTTCDCKEADQTMEHLLECPLLRQKCSLDNLMVYNDVAKECVRQWIGLV